RNEILTIEGLRSHALRDRSVECAAFRLVQQPLVGGYKKAARTTRRIGDREICARTWIRLHTPHDRIDENARREISPGPFLSFACRFLKEPFVGGGLHVHAKARPLSLIDQIDEALEIDRIVEPRLSFSIDVTEDAGRLAEGPQHVRVVLEE